MALRRAKACRGGPQRSRRRRLRLLHPPPTGTWRARGRVRKPVAAHTHTHKLANEWMTVSSGENTAVRIDGRRRTVPLPLFFPSVNPPDTAAGFARKPFLPRRGTLLHRSAAAVVWVFHPTGTDRLDDPPTPPPPPLQRPTHPTNPLRDRSHHAHPPHTHTHIAYGYTGKKPLPRPLPSPFPSTTPYTRHLSDARPSMPSTDNPPPPRDRHDDEERVCVRPVIQRSTII